MTLIFGSFLLIFGYFFLRTRLTAGDESNIPKLLIKRGETMTRHLLMQPALWQALFWGMSDTTLPVGSRFSDACS